MSIHPTAIIDPKAELHSTVSVGPFTIIEAGVQIGEGTTIESGCRIHSGTVIGKNNKIYHNAVIGGLPQDLSFDPKTPTGFHIGDNNTIREGCQFHRATKVDKPTRVGNDCFIMELGHIAHDVTVGNNFISVHGMALAGHVVIEDRVFVSGLSAVHQFCRIGANAMIGGLSKIVKDVPPFAMVDGNPALVMGINVIGLRRSGMSAPERDAIKKAFKIIYNSGLNTTQALERLKSEEQTSHVKHIIEFIEASDRGILDHG